MNDLVLLVKKQQEQIDTLTKMAKGPKRNKSGQAVDGSGHRVCFRCKQADHLVADCPQPAPPGRANNKSKKSDSSCNMPSANQDPARLSSFTAGFPSGSQPVMYYPSLPPPNYPVPGPTYAMAPPFVNYPASVPPPSSEGSVSGKFTTANPGN